MIWKLVEKRWAQIAEEQWRVYAVFALAEVILVTLGILLAVQVDNWNEERREQRDARELLADVRDDLQANLMEIEGSLIVRDWDRWEWDINQSVVMPYFARHIRGSLSSRYTARPNDFDALKQNPEFMNVVGVLSRTRDYGVELCEETAEELRALLAAIDAELGVQS